MFQQAVVPFKISLRAARVNANLSQKQAAQELHISQKTLINYESGATIPNWEVVDNMSQLYGIPVEHLFFGR